MKAEYIVGLFIIVLAGVGLFFLFASPRAASPSVQQSVQAAVTGERKYKEIVDPSGFVNTPSTSSGQATPISIGELVGKKVILVDFLTYSCINCQRTFPYLNAWYAKYKDQGLEIVGIHTPEFAFEKDIDNVREAMKRFGIMHPVVLDNDYATWNAYGNQYWPRKYLIDIHGNVVYDHIGEGGYDETEMKIRELLAERAKVLGMGEPPMGDTLAASVIPETAIEARSPETYFGSARNEYLANGTPGRSGTQQFSLPKTFMHNALYLGGSWNIVPEYAAPDTGGSVAYSYSAKRVYLVAEANAPVSVEVLQDGKPVGSSGGADVKNGMVTIGESRLYELVDNPAPGIRTLELRVNGTGLRLYTFTFG